MKKLLLIFLLLAGPLAAQQSLTVEDVIRQGLQHNFQIQIARNEAVIAAGNTSLGTAELLPSLNASGSYFFVNSDEESNSPSSLGNTDTETRGAEISLDWTLFDGFKMFASRNRYSELTELGELQARERIEQVVVQISQAFFYLVRQEQLLEVAQDTRDISETRLEKERVRRELGGASSTDYLNAQVSFNDDQAFLLNQQLAVDIARQELNVLLGRNPDSPLKVSSEITIPEFALSWEETVELAEERNAALLVAEQNRKIADRDVQVARAPFLPRLLLTAGYGYLDRNVSGDALLPNGDLRTESTDASIGLVLSFNLFNGTRDRVGLRNARLAAQNSRLARSAARYDLLKSVRRTFDTFNQRLQLVELEQQNVAAAQQNLELQRDSYRLGASSSLEFRDAQVSLARTQTALIVARYQARISLLELEQLTGNLRIE